MDIYLFSRCGMDGFYEKPVSEQQLYFFGKAL
ncbi:hypothetical protein PAECIP111892_03138 [Paenibacillus auburnensis]|uniref:Response regulatory domain-containing protein n=1 Tax=Paenibacillus auburnensis TaxID=2905649 RepID=A0ABM9CC41_9BACL|nr:hypothetical protein PAECIP111892_03138 [Paenibacillus auburnensis]